MPVQRQCPECWSAIPFSHRSTGWNGKLPPWKRRCKSFAKAAAEQNLPMTRRAQPLRHCAANSPFLQFVALCRFCGRPTISAKEIRKRLGSPPNWCLVPILSPAHLNFGKFFGASFSGSGFSLNGGIVFIINSLDAFLLEKFFIDYYTADPLWLQDARRGVMATPPYNHLSISSKKKNYTKAPKDERVKCF